MAFFGPAPIFNFLTYYLIGTHMKASSIKKEAVGPNWERYRDENSGNRRFCSYEQELTYGYIQNFAQRIILDLYVKKKFCHAPVMLMSCYFVIHDSFVRTQYIANKQSESTHSFFIT